MEKCIASKLTLELKFLKNLKQKLNELGNNEYFIENWIKIKNKKKTKFKKKAQRKRNSKSQMLFSPTGDFFLLIDLESILVVDTKLCKIKFFRLTLSNYA